MNALFYLEAVDGQLEVYEDKVALSRKGASWRINYGKNGIKTIMINSIKCIVFREATTLKRGEISFQLNSAPNSTNPLLINENYLLFTKADNELAKEIKDYIEKRITEIRTPSAAPAASSQSGSADEILKYKNLLDMGAITQEEFDLKKKQLLGL